MTSGKEEIPMALIIIGEWQKAVPGKSLAAMIKLGKGLT